MMADDGYLVNATKEAIILGNFKTYCDKNNGPEAKLRLRNILHLSPDPTSSVIGLFKNDLKISIDKTAAAKIHPLLIAFLNKSNYRKSISIEQKQILLKKQSNKCAICGSRINEQDHADHIVPFKYVGDELPDNLQMLCAHCNQAKNSSLAYQINFFLNLV